MKFYSKSVGIFDLIIVFFLILGFYFMSFKIPTDIPLHAQFIKNYAYGNKPFQVNFLYYLVIYAFSFFEKTTSTLLVVSVYVLSAATFAKYLLVKKIIISEIPAYLEKFRTASWCSFLLLMCFSLPSILYFSHDFYYLLSYPPTVWHNSTTIFAMPFVLLLYWLSMKQFTEHRHSRLFYIGILIILNVLIKPSFLFVYLVVYPLLLLKRYRFGKLFWINIIPISIAVILVLIEYYYIFIINESGSSGEVTVTFFHFVNTWAAKGDALYIAGILVSTLISSFLFPIVVLAKNRHLLKEYSIQFAIWGTMLAVIIANVFAETGERATDGNFLWQSFMCAFLLFFICLLHIIKLGVQDPRGWKPYRLEIMIFLLHVIAGLFYFLKISSTSSYF